MGAQYVDSTYIVLRFLLLTRAVVEPSGNQIMLPALASKRVPERTSCHTDSPIVISTVISMGGVEL